MCIRIEAALFRAVAIAISQALCLLLLAPWPAHAAEQAPDLFMPMPASQAADGMQEQSQRLARIRKRPTTAAVEMVQVDIGALQQERTRMVIPGAEPLVMSRRKLKARDDRNFTWQGSLPDFPGASTLVVRNGNITGSIHDSDGNVYRVEPVGGGAHAIIRIDTSRFPPEGEPADKSEPRSDSKPAAAYAPLAAATTSDVPAAPVVIDVTVAYTSAARAAVADIDALIDLAIAVANISYQNSGIGIELVLVDSFEVAYDEKKVDFATIVNSFAGSPSIGARRDQFGADMAALLVDNNTLCGLAAGVGVPAEYAYVAVHYECAAANYSLAHEFGHLQGAHHEPQSDPSTAPLPYGHAFRHETLPAFRTVMATDCPTGCQRMPIWSSPLYTFRGVQTGTPELMDNARVLNETAAIVSQFRARPAATPALLP